MNYELDLTDSIEYTIVVERNRTLLKSPQVEVYSGETYIGLFDFAAYSGAILEVRTKPNDFNKVISFSTADGSIDLLSNGIFTLTKSASAMNVKAGEYYYDMYLTSTSKPKRGFLYGKFIVKETVAK